MFTLPLFLYLYLLLDLCAALDGKLAAVLHPFNLATGHYCHLCAAYGVHNTVLNGDIVALYRADLRSIAAFFAARRIIIRALPHELKQPAERTVNIIPRADGYCSAADFSDNAIIGTDLYIHGFAA